MTLRDNLWFRVVAVLIDGRSGALVSLRIVSGAALAAASVCLLTSSATAAAHPHTENTALAETFRPILAFDSGEHWRPISVRSIVADKQVRLCQAGRSCAPAVSLAEIAASAGGNLDIAGDIQVPESHRWVEPFCVSLTLLDCDSGAAAHIYYHVVTHGAYRYIDYWLGHRFNDAPTRPTALRRPRERLGRVERRSPGRRGEPGHVRLCPSCGAPRRIPVPPQCSPLPDPSGRLWRRSQTCTRLRRARNARHLSAAVRRGRAPLPAEHDAMD